MLRITLPAVCCALPLFAALNGPGAAADLGEPSLKDGPYEEARPFGRSFPFYLAIRGGIAFPEDTEFGALATTITNSYDDGYFVGGAAGMDLGRFGAFQLRGDIEAGYRQADIDSHNVGGLGTFSGADAFGETSVTYGLANLYADFDTGSFLKPYISAGGGIGHVDFDNHGVTGVGTALSESGTGYAFQAGAGVSMDVGNGFDLEVGYRYFAVYDVELTAADGTTSDVDVEDHQILFGLRKSF